MKDEWYPAHTKDALSWTLTQDYVPIYPKTMEKVIGKIPVESFNVTGPGNIKSLKKIIGKKKSISTFTKANKSSPLAKGRGVQTGSGGVIFHVEGLLLAIQYMDFDTVPDRTGRRWVKGRYIFDNDPMIVKSAIKKAGLPDYSAWIAMENDIADKYEMSDYKDYKDNGDYGNHRDYGDYKDYGDYGDYGDYVDYGYYGDYGDYGYYRDCRDYGDYGDCGD